MNIIKTVEEIRKKLNIRLDAEDEEAKPKKHSALSTRLPYALCKEAGIDTEGMTPSEAWEAYEGKTGKSAEKVKESKMADSKPVDYGKMRDSLKKLRSEHFHIETQKLMAEQRLNTAKQNVEMAEKIVSDKKKELKDKYKDLSISEIQDQQSNVEKELSDVSEWLETHKKKWSEMTEEESKERAEKRNRKSELIEQQMELSTEVANRRMIKSEERRLNDAKNALDEAQKKYDDIDLDSVSKKLDKEKGKYEKAATKRNEETLKKFKSVDDCKTSEDVTNYLRAKGYFSDGKSAYEVDTSVDLSAMSDENAKTMAKNIERMLDDYPKIKGKIAGVESHDFSKESNPSLRNCYGFASGNNIYINEKHFGDAGSAKAREDFENGVETGFHPKGTTMDYIYDHESTHVIEHLVNEHLGGKKASDIVMQRVQERMDGKYNPENDDYYRYQVSGYALENRGIERDKDGKIIKVDKVYGGNTEWLAEAMGEARTSKNPRPVAVAVREEFEKIMKEVGLL